ncbi:hemolysin XhlA family protein [Shinella sp. HZN7]|uniref:hemolysin XhlA family protein n=1 Tax=Shinella sp. (strain HZN7) TaxID=879274 RepID=UPI0007DA574E|nr:hemolysin XhlA family protein [Shinella sp. HZN7]ANH04999.1 hypothetical protein shn_13750 [Shinella sp. HZN7]
MTDPATHLHARIEKAHDRLDEMDNRVTVLERNEAVSGERMSVIQSSLIKIDNNISRIVWIFVTAVIGAFAAFVLKGGLNGL